MNQPVVKKVVRVVKRPPGSVASANKAPPKQANGVPVKKVKKVVVRKQVKSPAPNPVRAKAPAKVPLKTPNYETAHAPAKTIPRQVPKAPTVHTQTPTPRTPQVSGVHKAPPRPSASSVPHAGTVAHKSPSVPPRQTVASVVPKAPQISSVPKAPPRPHVPPVPPRTMPNNTVVPKAPPIPSRPAVPPIPKVNNTGVVPPVPQSAMPPSPPNLQENYDEVEYQEYSVDEQDVMTISEDSGSADASALMNIVSSKNQEEVEDIDETDPEENDFFDEDFAGEAIKNLDSSSLDDYEEEYDEIETEEDYEEVEEEEHIEDLYNQYADESENPDYSYDDEEDYPSSYDYDKYGDDAVDYEEDEELYDLEDDTDEEEDLKYASQLRTEEASLYGAYKDTMVMTKELAVINNIQIPLKNISAKNLLPKLRPDVAIIIKADMYHALGVFKSLYPDVLNDVTGQENDQELFDIVQSAKDEFIKELLFNFMQVDIEIEACKIRTKAVKVIRESKILKNDTVDLYVERKEVADAFIQKLKRRNLPINEDALIKNYLKAASNDPGKAHRTLITNPAFFSPIIIEKMPKKFFGLIKPNAKDCKAMNKKIGSVLKHLTA